jgi:hypothetical protein
MEGVLMSKLPLVIIKSIEAHVRATAGLRGALLRWKSKPETVDEGESAVQLGTQG